MRKRRQLNNEKYYLYCFSPGKTEFEYFRKYINEKLNNKVKYSGEALTHQLSSNIKNDEQHNLFRNYENKLKNKNELDKHWQAVEECFMTLKEWYNDNLLSLAGVYQPAKKIDENFSSLE